MKKYITSSLLIMTLLLPFSLYSESISVKNDAPTKYTVKKGDTLWGISKKFLNKPWQWASLWGFNKKQIKNPHLIYPGQVLILSYINGEPRLSIEGQNSSSLLSSSSDSLPVVVLKPDIEIGDHPILALGEIKKFLQYPNIISKKDLLNTPTLVTDTEEKFFYSLGDRVYAKNITQAGKYLIYRTNKEIIDPFSHKNLGLEIIFIGEAMTITPKNSENMIIRNELDKKELKKNERYTQNKSFHFLKFPTQIAQPLIITKVISEIKGGDKLLYIPEFSQEQFSFTIHTPDPQLQARVIHTFNKIDLMESASRETILLNKGSLDGLNPGAILSIYHKKDNKKWSDLSGPGHVIRKDFAYPLVEVGKTIIYKTSEHVSYALILSTNEVRNRVVVGDLVMGADKDLEDFLSE